MTIMKQIDKDVLVTEIEQRRSKNAKNKLNLAASFEDNYLLSFINTLEVKDPYEECIQYDSINAGIQCNAEIYSFNIESKLFDQLTKEQQGLWREEIEQAYISGGETGVEFARDTRYKENLKVKEVDLEEEKEVIIKGFVAVDNGGDKMTWNPTGRRVAFFPKKPVRDLLTDSHYWAAHISPYDVIHLGYDAFPELKWEDEPIEVKVIVKAQKGE